MATVHLLIKGKVQNVFYRDTSKETAEKLGICGWVMNTPDGHVEAMLTGSEEMIGKFIEWAHRGPEAAVVTEVVRTDRAHEPFEGFVITG